MSLKNELYAALRQYDGRALTILSEAAARFGQRPGYLGALIDLAPNRVRFVSAGATWMLKAALEGGSRLTPPQTARLLGKLDGITAWQARLHVCQVSCRLDVPEEHQAAFRRWLTPLLAAERPFLRAWALDALCRLDATHCETLLDRMAEDPAASVRARVRNLRGKLAPRPG
ncbi:MAG: hypothetical protein RLO50_12015 [Azospirillaceae bacterium]